MALSAYNGHLEAAASGVRQEDNNKSKKTVFKWTIFEIGALLITAAAIIAFRFTPTWLRYSALFIVPSVTLVFLLAGEQGLISKLLSLVPFEFIGSISGYAFLIHLYTIRLTTLFVQNVIPNLPDYVSVLLALAVTLIAAVMAKQIFGGIEKRITSRKKASA